MEKSDLNEKMTFQCKCQVFWLHPAFTAIDFVDPGELENAGNLIVLNIRET